MKSNICHKQTPKWKGSVDFTACLPIFFSFSIHQRPYVPNLMLSAESEDPCHFLSHICYTIIGVPVPQPRRWWLCTIATGTQCVFFNQRKMHELTSDKQNYTQYMDFCHKPLPIIAVQGPQPRRWWLLTIADWGPMWCLKSTHNAQIGVGQTKLSTIHEFLS